MKRLSLLLLLALLMWGGATWTLHASPAALPVERGAPQASMYSPENHCLELLKNGDFESGSLAPWKGGGSFGVGSGRASQYGAWMGGDNGAKGKLWQKVAIPGSANLVRLTFWWMAESPQTLHNQTQMDVIVESGSHSQILRTLTAGASAGRWQQETLDLSSFAGGTATLVFSVRVDREVPTTIRLDDISLLACKETPAGGLCRLEDVSPGPGSTPARFASVWGKMLSISITGVEGVSGPATSWTTDDGGILVEHLAAADQDGQPILYYRTPEHDWMTVNISEKTGATIALERPESWVFDDTSAVLERLAAPADNGDLLLFTWHSGSDWRVENLTTLTGKKIIGPVTSWDTEEDGQHVEHIAARGDNDELLIFWRKAGGQWAVTNVSTITNQKVGDAPFGWAKQAWNGWAEYLAAPAPNGDLIFFFRQSGAAWQKSNLTASTGQKVAGSATAWTSHPAGSYLHLAAPAPNDDLVVFTYDAVESVWRVENLTTITGKKVISPAVSWVIQDGGVERERLAARGAGGHLLVFSRSTGASWTVTDVTIITNRTISHTPTSWTLAQSGSTEENLAAPSWQSHLHIFTLTKNHAWQTDDVSLKAAGRSVYAASEKAGVWFSRDYGRFWQQSTRPQPPQNMQTIDGLNSPNVLDVAVSPDDPSLVLAATDRDHRNPSLAGIYRSTDGGATWTRVHTFICNGEVQPATQVRFAPDDSSLLYAAGGCAIAISHDHGLTWHEFVPPGIEQGARVFHVAVSPLLAGHRRNAFACGRGNLWFSPDGGNTWYKDVGASETLPHGFCGKTTNGNGDAAQTLAVDPSRPNRLYLAYQNDANGPAYFQPAIYGKDGGYCNHPVIYDANDNGLYDSGDKVLRGSDVQPNAPLRNDVKIKFVDSTSNGQYDDGEAVIYDANGNAIFDTDGHGNKEALLAGDAPDEGTSLKEDAKIRYVDLGTPFEPRGCGEGSLWYGDLSDFDRRQGVVLGKWRQLPGPPVYWGNTASGAAFVFTHAINREKYLVFFGDQDTLHVSIGKPQQGSWHRLDGWDASRCKQHNRMGNVTDVHVDPHGLAFSPDFDLTLKRPDVESPYDKNMELAQCLGGRLWYSNDGGVYRSDDCGETWLPAEAGLSTLAAINVAGVARPGKAPALYFGTGDNDDFYSLDGGAIWRNGANDCGDCGAWYADPAQPDRVLDISRTIPLFGLFQNQSNPGDYPDAGDPHQLYLAPKPTAPPGQDSGVIMYPVTRPIIQTLANEAPLPDGDYVVIQKIDPKDGGPERHLLVRARDNIHKSSPWIQQGPDLPDSVTVVQAASGHEAPTYYVGDYTNLWKSHRDAHGNIDDWRQIVPGGGATRAYRFFVNPYDADDIYIVDTDAVRHSTDGGATWVVDAQLDAALTEHGRFSHDCPTSWIYLTFHDCILNEMVFDRESPRTRFAAGLAGVFYSDDGTNWSRLVETRALPSRPIGLYFDPITDPNNRSLYIAFLGRGVMRCSPIPGQPPTPTPSPTPAPSYLPLILHDRR